jgi:hypothetical protein
MQNVVGSLIHINQQVIVASELEINILLGGDLSYRQDSKGDRDFDNFCTDASNLITVEINSPGTTVMSLSSRIPYI